MALWGLLWFTKFLDIQNIHVFGDSKVFTDYVEVHANSHKSSLQGWLKQIKLIWSSLNQPSIQHTCRNLNSKVDKLSKLGVREEVDGFHVNIKMQENWHDAGVYPILG